MFSVIIPLYNKEIYIKRAIASVLNQTYSDFELIIVNDGSIDNSLEVVKEFSDSRLSIFDQKNQGVAVARNNGVEVSQYHLIAFLDADDWWDSCFLEEMQRLIEKFPDAGFFGANYNIVKNHKSIPARIGLPIGFEAGYIEYFEVYARTFWVPINCSFVVVRRSAFEEVGGFKTSLKFGEDLDLWIRIALHHRVGYVNKCLAYSNQDVESTGRALGAGKRWHKSEHVIFQLEYLRGEEKKNSSLKELLDGLRVRLLVDFYLDARYPEETGAILGRVDFSKQPVLYRTMYGWPRLVAVWYFQVRQLGSIVKQSLIRTYLKLSS